MMFGRMQTFTLAMLLAVLLAACGATSAQPAASTNATAPATVAAAPTSVAAPTQDTDTLPTTAAPAAPTAAPAAGATTQASGDMRVFQIVPEQSEASYEVQEQFLNRDLPSMAVGTTKAVEGEFQFTAAGKPTGQVTKFTVDLSTLASDSPMRDRRIRTQWLESEKYPLATFVSTGVEGVPDTYTEGQEVSFKVLGNLTVREVTRPVTFDVTGKLEGDTVTGNATTKVLMKDFGFDPPSVAGILTVQDGVTIRVQFTAKAA